MIEVHIALHAFLEAKIRVGVEEIAVPVGAIGVGKATKHTADLADGATIGFRFAAARFDSAALHNENFVSRQIFHLNSLVLG